MKAMNVQTKSPLLKAIVGTIGMLSMSLMANVAEARVAKSERVLVVVSELDSSVAPELRGLYGAIEGLTQATSQVILGSEYASVLYLKNNQATLANYAALLQTLSARNSVKAIDTIMSVHGSTGRLLFADGSKSMTTLERAVLPATMSEANRTTLRRKLRMMYNLSCFGRSHNATFRALGYDIVAGSEGVNANAEAEFVPVLSNWRIGGRFIDGFGPSNNGAALLATDGPLRFAGQMGRNSLAQTNSHKIFAGFSSTRIDSDPR